MAFVISVPIPIPFPIPIPVLRFQCRGLQMAIWKCTNKISNRFLAEKDKEQKNNITKSIVVDSKKTENGFMVEKSLHNKTFRGERKRNILMR